MCVECGRKFSTMEINLDEFQQIIAHNKALSNRLCKTIGVLDNIYRNIHSLNIVETGK